jgi:hypothetical protein
MEASFARASPAKLGEAMAAIRASEQKPSIMYRWHSDILATP